MSNYKQSLGLQKVKVGVLLAMAALFAVCAVPQVQGQHFNLQTINPPGATFSSASGLNNYGSVVGLFELPGGTLQGFIYNGTAGYKTIAFPGAISTQATGINDNDTVVGIFQGTDGFTHGYSLVNDKFTQYDVDKGSSSTYVLGVNNAGSLVGYVDNDGANQGFVNINGTVTQFTFEGNTTSATSINNNNETVGWFIPPPFIVYHGFYRDATGKMTQIDYPGAVSTACIGISDLGFVTGYYIDSNNVSHGFAIQGGHFRTTSLLPEIGQSNNAENFVGYYIGKNGENYGYLAKRMLTQ